MKFYRATVHYEEIYYDRRKSLGKLCLDLNAKFWDSQGKIHVLVSHITCDCMEVICAVNNPVTKDKYIMEGIKSYLSELISKTNISSIKDYKIDGFKEITLNNFNDLLDEYSIDTLIEDKEAIKETIGVSAGSVLYKEKLFDTETLNATNNQSYFFDKDEKKRIKLGHKIEDPVIAPIHYVIYEDDEEIRKTICNELLGYLWSKGRVCNRRMVIIDDEDTIFNKLRKKVYNLNSLDGGVVILDLKSEVDTAKTYFDLISEDKNSTYSDKFTIIIIANTDNIDGYNAAIKDSFYSMAFYPIINPRLNCKNAKKYFEELIRIDGLEISNNEWEELFTNEEYTYFEIGKMYKKWYRNSYYAEQRFSQYKEIIKNYFSVEEDSSIGARIELEKLIGLAPVKKLIEEIVDYHKLRKIKSEMGVCDSSMTMHMAFVGNPGTAKTTVARIVAKLLKEEGILKKGKLIEVGRGDLVDKYVGWTAKNIKEYFRKAKGSVLFIDEAYSLLDGQNSFGDEAINTIVQEMENMKDEVVVIMAGYKSDMNKFISKNSGMKSRIQFFVDFPDYSDEEKYSILEYLANDEKVILGTGVKEIFYRIINGTEYVGGNGRSVRNVYEKAKMKQAKRLLSMNGADIKNEINVLEAADFYGI